MWGIFTACLCSPSSRTFYSLAVKPQVTFASLSSPAVMDIRPLRGRLLETIFYMFGLASPSHIKKRLSLLSLLSLKTTQAKSLKNIVFKNNASGWPFPFHMICFSFSHDLFSLFTCFVISFSPESRLKNASLSSYPDRGTCIPRPKYMRTPTEIHAYPDRNTCVPRPKYMRTPTEIHAYPDRNTCVPRPRYMRISVGVR